MHAEGTGWEEWREQDEEHGQTSAPSSLLLGPKSSGRAQTHQCNQAGENRMTEAGQAAQVPLVLNVSPVRGLERPGNARIKLHSGRDGGAGAGPGKARDPVVLSCLSPRRRAGAAGAPAARGVDEGAHDEQQEGEEAAVHGSVRESAGSVWPARLFPPSPSFAPPLARATKPPLPHSLDASRGLGLHGLKSDPSGSALQAPTSPSSSNTFVESSFPSSIPPVRPPSIPSIPPYPIPAPTPSSHASLPSPSSTSYPPPLLPAPRTPPSPAFPPPLATHSSRPSAIPYLPLPASSSPSPSPPPAPAPPNTANPATPHNHNPCHAARLEDTSSKAPPLIAPPTRCVYVCVCVFVCVCVYI